MCDPSPPPLTLYPQKWTIKLLFKSIRICKNETKYKIPPTPPLIYVDVINTSFRSSRHHLAVLLCGEKSCICSENLTNLVLWFEAPLAIWYDLFMCFLLLGLWFIIKTKVIVQKLGCEKIFYIKLDGQTTLTAKYKGFDCEVWNEISPDKLVFRLPFLLSLIS